MSAPPGVVVQTIVPPRPTSTQLNHSEGRRLYALEYRAYVAACVDANAQEGQTVAVLPMRTLIGREYLTNLLGAGAFDEGTADDITNDQLFEWLTPSGTEAELDHVPLEVVELWLSSCRWAFDEKFSFAVDRLLSDVVNHIMDHAARAMLSQDRRHDGVIKLVVQLIPNQQLRTNVETLIESNHAGCRKNWLAFCKALRGEAARLDAVRTANVRERGGSSGKQPRAPTPKSSDPGSSKQSEQQGRGRKRRRFDDHHRGGAPGDSSARERNEVPFCLNKKTCVGEQHYIADCPKSSPETKARLLGEYKRNRPPREKKPKVNRLCLPVPSVDLPEQRVPNRVQLLIDGVPVSPSRIDTGADVTLIPVKLLDSLDARGVHLERLPLPAPVCVEGVGGPSSSLRCEQYVVVKNLTCSFSGHPVNFKNARMLVPNDGSYGVHELLLGEDVLAKMGFSFSDFLRYNAERLEVLDLADVDDNPLDSELHVHRAQLHPVLMPDLPPCEPDSSAHPDEAEDVVFKIGANSVSELATARKRMVERAVENGLPNEHREELTQLVEEFSDIFRLRLDEAPPAQVPPMTLKMKPDVAPTRAPPRRYNPRQTAFISKYCKKLVDNGLAKRVAKAEWISAPLLIRKDPPAFFRFTIDARGPNYATVADDYQMPDLEAELASTQGATCFANLDFAQAYWQVPLDPESASVFTLRGADGLYAPTRVPQGARNAATHFQRVTHEFFEHFSANLRQWCDDLALHTTSPDHLLDIMRQVFVICRKQGLFLHAGKCYLFQRQLQWCGRIISAEGVRFNPRHIDGLLEMAGPTTAADLQQYLCGVNWMRTAIPGYARLADPLLQLLRKCQDKAGGLTKLKLRAVRLRPYWNPELKQAFVALKEAVLQRVTLAHPDATKVTCLYTDASTEYYAAVCTQIPREDLQRPVDEQRHEPLAFISGRFVKASLNWSVAEKEAFAVLVSMERLRYLTLPQEVQIYTDHKNLLSLYNPRAAQPPVAAHVASKLQRWGIKPSAFCYRIWHVDGDSNFMADLMTRWARGKVLRVVMVPPPTTPDPDTFLETWLDDLRTQQALLPPADRDSFTMRQGFLRAHTPPGIYVPASKQLRLRLLIAAHCGTAGHRSFHDTLAKLQFASGGYSWPTLLDDVRAFITGCLHCQATDGPYRIPRPWAEALHATRPNAILHMDWLYIGVSVSGHVYILILKDDLSSYVWLRPFIHADGASTVKLLSEWMAAFGICPIWVSDQGSHFLNNVMRELAASLRVRHQFTTAYCPWTNGTVEVVNRAVLQHLRKLTSELNLAHGQWPTLVPIVQFMLTQSPSPKLGGRTPLEVFTGHGTDQALPPAMTRLSEQALATLRSTFIDSLRHLDAMHKACAETATRKRQALFVRTTPKRM